MARKNARSHAAASALARAPSSSDLKPESTGSSDEAPKSSPRVAVRPLDEQLSGVPSSDFSTELSGTEVSSSEISAADVTCTELSGTEVTSTELSSAEVSSAEVSSAEVSSAEVSSAEVSSAQPSSAADVTPVELASADLSGGESAASAAEAEMPVAASTVIEEAKVAVTGASVAEEPKVATSEANAGDDLAAEDEVKSPVNYDDDGLMEVEIDESLYRFDAGKQGTALCLSVRGPGSWRWRYLGELRWDGRDLRSRSLDRRLLQALSKALREFSASDA